MRSPSPFVLLFAGGLLLLLLVLFPHAAAQPTPLGNVTLPQGFTVSCPDSFLPVDYLGTARSTCKIHDLTEDTPNGLGGQATPGTLPHSVSVTLLGTDPSGFHGWTVSLGQTFFPMWGGATVDSQITVQNTPRIDISDFAFTVLYTFDSPNYKANQSVTFGAKVKPYDSAVVSQKTFHRDVAQDVVTTFTMQIDNVGVYPDVYAITVNAPSALHVAAPPSAYVPPFQSRNVTVSALTPHDQVYELGRSYSLGFKVASQRGTGIYSTSASLHVSGAYVPTYWIPLTLVGLIAAVIVTRRTREGIETRRLESGRPRRVPLTPRQAVLLAELKREDPETYKERRAKIDAIYATRRGSYREVHKAQVAKDREERRLARIEYNEARKRKKEEKLAAKRQKKVDRKAANAQRRIDQKAAKVEGKALKLKGKELGRKRKVLEKARAKQAKVDAKQAMVDAKAAAVAAKAQAKADKAAAKQAKKAAKKGGPPPGGQ